MKNIHPLSGWTFTIFFGLISSLCFGQPEAGHFVYKIISYEVIDSSRVGPEEVTFIMEYMKDDFYAEIFFNKTWIVALKNRKGAHIKKMFNRKSMVLYTYFEEGDIKRMRIDSFQAIKQKNKALLAAIDTLKSGLQVVEYPKETRKIYGFPCHKVTTPGLGNDPQTSDEIWMAKFAKVPDLIFPDHLYFLIEGLPMEITQDFLDVKVKWGVVDILPVTSDDDIFKQSSDGYEVSVEDTEKLIYDCIHFLQTYRPESD